MVKINIIRIIILFVILSCWQLLGSISNDIFFFIGTPIAIFEEFLKLIVEENLHFHFFITGSEALLGLIIGTIVRIMFG